MNYNRILDLSFISMRRVQLCNHFEFLGQRKKIFWISLTDSKILAVRAMTSKKCWAHDMFELMLFKNRALVWIRSEILFQFRLIWWRYFMVQNFRTTRIWMISFTWYKYDLSCNFCMTKKDWTASDLDLETKKWTRFIQFSWFFFFRYRHIIL